MIKHRLIHRFDSHDIEHCRCCSCFGPEFFEGRKLSPDCGGPCFEWDLDTILWAANVGIPIVAAHGIIHNAPNNWVFFDTVDHEERWKRWPERMERMEKEWKKGDITV